MTARRAINVRLTVGLGCTTCLGVQYSMPHNADVSANSSLVPQRLTCDRCSARLVFLIAGFGIHRRRGHRGVGNVLCTAYHAAVWGIEARLGVSESHEEARSRRTHRTCKSTG